MGSELGITGRGTGTGGLFRLPSSPLFLGLIPAFSGQARLGDLSEEWIGTTGAGRETTALVRPAEVRTFVLCQSPDGKTQTSVRLLHDGPDDEAVDLQSAVLKQFGPLGLKHLLGVFLAAEDTTSGGPLPGGFVLDLNRHLDRLGYKRSALIGGQRSHSVDHLADARSVLELLCGLTMIHEIRLGPKRGTTIRIRFLLNEAVSESWHETVAEGDRLRERTVLRERAFLRINPYLYSAALSGGREQHGYYTYQLRQLVREHPQQRPWALVLGAALPVRFGLNGGTPVQESARSILALGGTSAPDLETIERVEETLKYMVDQGYLGAFETERYRYEVELAKALTATPDHPPRARLTLKSAASGRATPDDVWRIEPPHYLPELLKTAAHAPPLSSGISENVLISPAPEPLLPGLEGMAEQVQAGEVLRLTRERLGLSQGQLARTLGYTQAAISMAEAGKRPRMALKILEAAQRLRSGG